MLNLHRDKKIVRREPGRDGKILCDHRQDGSDVCTSWAKLNENADDIYFSSIFIHIVAYYRSVLFVVALSR